MGSSGASARFSPAIRENRRMAKKDEAEAMAPDEVHIIIEDEAELTPKELAQERKAALDEHKRLFWLSQTPEQLAGRIPVSVFAMGDMVPGT